MNQTVDAILEPNGTIRLLEPMAVDRPTRVQVTMRPQPTKEDYDAAFAYSNSPEGHAAREAALADYRAGRVHTSAEVFKMLESLARETEQR